MAKKKTSIELIEFKKYKKETLISVNIFLKPEDALELESWWFTKVDRCQPPLIETHKNGFNIHIPWTLKKENDV